MSTSWRCASNRFQALSFTAASHVSDVPCNFEGSQCVSDEGGRAIGVHRAP
jgi:hypothetical protein